MSRRLVGVVAIVALVSLLLGATCERKTLFRFRSPLLGELSLPGPVTVNLRVPGGKTDKH